MAAYLAGIGAFALSKAVDNKLQLSHDFGYLIKARNYIRDMRELPKLPSYTVSDAWYETLAKFPNKDALVSADTGVRMTFVDIERLSNKISHWALSKGFKKGDCVALDMENRLEYLCTWLGLSKIGVIIAMVNFNIKAKPLIHSITIAKSVALIFGTEIAETISDVADALHQEGLKLYSYGEGGEAMPFADGNIDIALPSLSASPVDKSLRDNIKFTDTFCYIYTSGTTGLPKACKIMHLKYKSFGYLLPLIFECGPEEVIYCTLPLYHGAGGGLGVGALVCGGCTLVVRSKFSASSFWSDCKKYDCTVIQYIGELCRYLLGSPPGPQDKDHRVYKACGNGLRPEIWDEFQRRFNITEVGEFYGATEGNAGLMQLSKNYEGQGAVGRQGYFMRMVQGMRIVKFDIVNEVRGFSVRIYMCVCGCVGV